MSTGIVIAIIFAAALVLTSIVAAVAAYKTKASGNGSGKSLLARIIETLWQIPSMLWYPVQGLIYFIHGISLRFYSFIRDHLRTEEYKANKTQRLIRYAVSTVLHSHSNLLNSYLNRRAAKIFTLLLQIISFITTYAGFAFFLGTVNPVAPLFMAITVQGGAYYLLNYTSSRKRSGGWKRTLLLMFLISTSTLTSYMGIFNGVVRPVERMELQYNAYRNTAQAIIDRKIQIESNSQLSQRAIANAFTFLKNTNNDTELLITSLRGQIVNSQTVQVVPTSWIDENGNVRYGTRTVDVADANNTNNELNTAIILIEPKVSDLTAYLDGTIQANDVFSAYNAIINNKAKLDSSTDSDVAVLTAFMDALDTSKSIYQNLSMQVNGDIYDAGIISVDKIIADLDIYKFIADRDTRDKLYELVPQDYEILIATLSESDEKPLGSASPKNFLQSIMRFGNEAISSMNEVVVSKDTVRTEEIRNLLNKTVANNYNELNPLLSIEQSRSLTAAMNAAEIENTQLMPFMAPFRSSDNSTEEPAEEPTIMAANTNTGVRGEAIFSFAIAFMVDFFSVLIAWTLINKQKSILYYKRVGDLRANREEMLEDCLMYICLNSIQANQQANQDSMTRAEIQNLVVQKINEVMRDFIQLVIPVYLSDELNTFGYITEEALSELSPDGKRIFYTLSNAALIHPSHSSELMKIINAEFDEFKITADGGEQKAHEGIVKKYEGIFQSDHIYYLVSKNFHVWFCENFAELLQSSLLFTVAEENLFVAPTPDNATTNITPQESEGSK